MNFDRVASIYDATRGFPEEIADRIAERILDATHADRETRFLELGIGTGRVAAPFLRRGHDYSGVDISDDMLAVLAEKAGPASRLTFRNADVTELPFPDANFDVVLTVHLLHLIPDWPRALEEARRVLTPGGYFVMGHDRGLPGSPASEIRHQWRALVREIGAELRPEYGSWGEVESALIESGAYMNLYQAARWEKLFAPGDLLGALRGRVFSQTWNLSEETIQQVHERLLPWTQERYGPLDADLPSPWEFLLSVSRWPQQPGGEAEPA